jgi:hypothetical protein
MVASTAARFYARPSEENLCQFRKDLGVLNQFLIPPIDTDGMNAIELRSNAPATVEDLIGRIADLVLERQSLRACDADIGLIERNRVALVRAHQDLSQALIERHCRSVDGAGSRRAEPGFAAA